MIIFAIILVACALYIAIRNPNLKFFWGGPKFPDVFEIQKEIHEYSGISKDSYMKYLDTMDLVENTMDPNELYKALNHLKNISLSLPPDSDISDKLDALSDKLARRMEKHIMDYSLKNGKRFAPKYLNNLSVE